MRSFIYYSRTAPTSGGKIKEDLQKAGRLDIAIHTVIASFFLSHKIRTDTTLHLVFAGAPDPTKHLELKPETEGKTGTDKIYINKSNISQIIKKMLYKYKPDTKNEVFPGFHIEKKSFLQVVNELSKDHELYILDAKGTDIRSLDIKPNPIFILGDHVGLPGKELKRLKSIATPVSIGPQKYFASQTVAIVHNELDRRQL